MSKIINEKNIVQYKVDKWQLLLKYKEKVTFINL